MKHLYFPTSIFDEALAQRRLTNEKERLRLLQVMLGWLVENAGAYGFESGYVFGSVTKVDRFTQDSDVDVAVETGVSGGTDAKGYKVLWQIFCRDIFVFTPV